MIKVFLLAKKVTPVRMDIYNYIAKHVDFTVGYTVSIPEGAKFKTLKLEEKTLFRFSYKKPSLRRLLKKYDVAILPMDYNMLDVDFCLAFAHPCKIITWGIGVPASYTVRFDDPNVKNRMPFFVKHSDAVLFYTDYPKNKYAKLGYSEEKMFVAPNTTPVNKIPLERERNSILFVGSLYPAKQTDKLIEAYKLLKDEGVKLLPLYIIGDGSERERLEQMVDYMGLESEVFFCGAIYSDDELEKYYFNARAVISPDQAGLSVLKTMGYGVPFVTTKDAYTGGERLNITNGITGVLMDGVDKLADVLKDILFNPEKYLQMGKNAYDFYWKNRTPKHMAEGFLSAINFVKMSKN